MEKDLAKEIWEKLEFKKSMNNYDLDNTDMKFLVGIFDTKDIRLIDELYRASSLRAVKDILKKHKIASELVKIADRLTGKLVEDVGRISKDTVKYSYAVMDMRMNSKIVEYCKTPALAVDFAMTYAESGNYEKSVIKYEGEWRLRQIKKHYEMLLGKNDFVDIIANTAHLYIEQILQ